MTTQQKDVLVNKIMVYITVAFGGTILWYVMFSFMQSSLITTGYYLSLGCAALCIAIGFFLLFHKGIRKKMVNASSYARLSFGAAILFLVLWTPYIARALGFIEMLSRFPHLANITYSARFTLYLSYAALAVAIVINIILSFRVKDEQNAHHKK